MAVSVSYPGVYVEEPLSGRSNIVGVPTNITAFVGRAATGPVDNALTIFSFSDFQRIYGGLAADCPMSYSVQAYFNNGGSEAVIARLFEPVAAQGGGFAQIGIGVDEDGDQLILQAANPGQWGNQISAVIDTTGITDRSAMQFEEYGLCKDDLFNLTISIKNDKGHVIRSERFINLSVKPSDSARAYPQNLGSVLEHQSMFVRVAELSKTPPKHGATGSGVNGNDGGYLKAETYLGNQDLKTGIYLLENVDIFNLLCIPPDRRIGPSVPVAKQDLDPVVRQEAAQYCADRRAFYIVDPPAEWSVKAAAGVFGEISPTQVEIAGDNQDGSPIERNAAVYFPRVWQEDILNKSELAVFAPSGAIAGIIAATDAGEGVWKAPAGTDAGLGGVAKLEVEITDEQTGALNPLGINCLRTFPVLGSVIWGSRTLRGADVFEDDYKYIPVRRLTLFVEESLIRGTQWAVFEPNNEALWSALRLQVNSFMAGLCRQGAFYDYKVSCDATTTTQEDIDLGIVNIVVQFAPVNPAEFIVIQIQQKTGV